MKQKFFIFNLCSKSIGRYQLYLTDTNTTTRYHKNRPILPIPILQYRYIPNHDDYEILCLTVQT